MSFLSAIRRHFEFQGRVRKVSGVYMAELQKRGSDMEARAAYHLEHLGLYWQRGLGFLEQGVAPDSVLRGDIFAAIVLATDVGSNEILAAALLRKNRAFAAGWQQYLVAYGRAYRTGSEARERYLAAAEAFQAARMSFELR